MFRQLTHPATAIALVALFLAGSGGAFAAGRLIGSRDIADHSIQVRDLSPAAIRSLRGRAGAQGPAGANGTFDAAKIHRIAGDVVAVQPGGNATAIATCPAGEVAVGGGGSGSIAGIAASYPLVASGIGAPVGWFVIVTNDSGVSVNAQAAAVCAAP